MPWVRKMFRGGKVWVEVDDRGEIQSERGLVKIRYRKEDDRTYSARAGDVLDLDEAQPERLESAPRARKKKKKAARPAPKSGDVPEGAIVVYTDGSCYGNPGPAGVGVLLEWKGRQREISRYLGHATNNIAELTAIRDALEAVQRRNLPVRLYTDSAYAIGVLTEDWKVRENRELVQSIRNLMREFADLELCKVKGHSGDPGNERVDQLARDAIDNHQDA